MTEYNYYRISYSSLPSLGKFYPEGSSIRFRCLTIRDLKYLASINEKNSREIVNDIIQRAIKLEKLKFSSILEMDRLTLVFFIRTNTFMLSNEYQTEFDCPYCGKRVMKTFQVSDLAKRSINESKIKQCTIGDKIISGVYYKISDIAFDTGDPDIDLIMNWTNYREVKSSTSNEDIVNEILSLPADDFSRIKSVANSARCGILGYAIMDCDGCGEKMRVGVSLRDRQLFNHVQLTTVIKNRIQVSKYCGIDLSDDTPFNEVEMTIAVVNDLSKKEAEACEKRNRGVSSV